MISNVIDNLQHSRAEFACDMEYIKESSFEDAIDDRMSKVEDALVIESVADLKEGKELFESIDISDDDKIKEAEVNRILNATSNLSFNEMAGIE